MAFLFRNSSHSSAILIFYILLASFPGNGKVDRIPIPNNETIPAVIVFGDSIVDPGNNNDLLTIAKANFPPYGKDFQGGRPTGRFSNGKIPGDLLAEILGVKELVPAYLDPTLQIQDLLTGVSFASGAAGYDPLSATSASALTIANQVYMYKEYIAKIRAAVGDQRLAYILAKGMHVVCFGSNDITNTYYTTPISATININSYTDYMVSQAISFYQELYELGARKIGVLSAPPTGCVPSQRTLRGGLLRECADFVNQAMMLFNFKLSAAINSLGAKYPDAKIIYLDIYNPLLSLMQNPAQNGFEEGTRGCCGTGLLEVIFLCNPSTETCPEANKYLFFDSFHPSERGYEILVTQLVRNNINRFF